jgi:Protein of unknown function (DUF4199)
MMRTILTYGLLSGAAIIGCSIAVMVLSVGGPPHSSVWLGYLIMLIGLSAILVGVRQYRDKTLGGVIKFTTGLMMGLGIAVVASLVYVGVWEGYMAATHYSFMDEYTAHMLAAKRAAGVTGAAYAKVVAETDAMRRSYANPLYRMAETFIEIFPVGVLVALVSAALLRNPRFLPAKTPA